MRNRLRDIQAFLHTRRCKNIYNIFIANLIGARRAPIREIYFLKKSDSLKIVYQSIFYRKNITICFITYF